jgi:hypothetical protein
MIYPMLAFGLSGDFYFGYVNDTHVFNKNQIMNSIFFAYLQFVRLVRHISTVCDLQLKGPIISQFPVLIIICQFINHFFV